jgi:TadE-like protein
MPNTFISKSRMRRGAAAVEFAVSLSALFLFVFIGIEFFRASMLRHNADCAAYEAARISFVPGATNSDAVMAATDYLTRVGIKAGSVTVSPNPVTETTTKIQVDVQIPMNANSWIVPKFMNGKVIKGRSRLMTERPPAVLAAAMPVLPPLPPPPVPPAVPLPPPSI